MGEREFNCKKCRITIDRHNQFLHAGLCDKCFHEGYSSEEIRVIETSPDRIRELSKEREEENLEFKEFLKEDKLDLEEFGKIVKEVTGKINCTKCANCCKAINPALNSTDINRIAGKLNVSEHEFIKRYLNKNEGNEFELKQLPCCFLEDNLCRIYDSRPKDCREYPHLDKDVTFRTIQFLQNAEICPIAFNVLENAKKMLWNGAGVDVIPTNVNEYSVLELCTELGTGEPEITRGNIERFSPLLLAIEEPILQYYQENPSLKDSEVLASLKKMKGNIFSATKDFNGLENVVIARLKITLMFNEFSKRDVSLAFSRIIRFLKTQKSSGGNRAYLTFLEEQFNKMQEGPSHGEEDNLVGFMS